MKNANAVRIIFTCLGVPLLGMPAHRSAHAAIAQVPDSVGSMPVTSIGVAEGDRNQEFHRVVTPFILPDGRIVVPVAGSFSIRIFDFAGEFVNSFGREGSGPGEFQFLHAAWPRGDTIEALDYRLARITRFLPDGSVQDVPLRTSLTDLSSASGPFGAGWVVAGVASGGPGARDVVAVHRIGQDGTDLGRMADALGMIRTNSGPGPLSPRSVIAVSQARTYVGDGLVPRIAVFELSGRQAGSIEWTAPKARDISAIQRALIDSAVARQPSERAATLRRRLEAMPTAEQLPIVWRILVDELGYLWVRPYEPMTHSFALGSGPGVGGKWLVFSPDGNRVSEIQMPPNLEVSAVTQSAVVGITRDEMGVESVHVHRLWRH